MKRKVSSLVSNGKLISNFAINHSRTSQSASYPSTMAIWEYLFPHKILKNQQVPQFFHKMKREKDMKIIWSLSMFFHIYYLIFMENNYIQGSRRNIIPKLITNMLLHGYGTENISALFILFPIYVHEMSCGLRMVFS